MSLARFRAPGDLADAPADSAFDTRWHDLVAGLVARTTRPSGPGAYVDPSEVPLTSEWSRMHTWTGFPRPLLVEHRDDRAEAFRRGEDRDLQIEYLEWHVERSGDTITRVTFCTETPEYWRLLAEVSPDTVLRLYRELVHPEVRADDLFADGAYEPRNRWNTADGIVHYVMRINSMRDLLGVSQEVEPSGRAVDGYDALPYSRPTGADARISFDNWAMTRGELTVAPGNPPGLYIAGWDDTGWTRPDGSPVGDWWTVVRGRPGAALRVVYEVPAEEGFAVGDLRIGGRPVVFGGQLAEHVTVAAFAEAGRPS